jgi:hypothetical protein
MSKKKTQSAKASEQGFTFTEAGALKVITPGGVITIFPPYTEQELREIVAKGDSRLVSEDNDDDTD